MLTFTISTNSDIPKARLLAASIKKFHPNWIFYLILADKFSDDSFIKDDNFDKIIYIDQLNIPNFKSFMFKSISKDFIFRLLGYIFLYLTNKNFEKIIYFSFDYLILSEIDYFSELLSKFDIIFISNFNTYNNSSISELNNTINEFGYFNHGFLAISNKKDAINFINYFIKHVEEMVNFDKDYYNKFFLLSSFLFENIYIVNSINYNIKSILQTNNRIIYDKDNLICINSSITNSSNISNKLKLFQFENSDTGAGRLNKYLFYESNKILNALWNSYDSQLKNINFTNSNKIQWSFGFFDNGHPISDKMRLLYNNIPELQDKFPDPFSSENENSFYNWYKIYPFKFNLKHNIFLLLYLPRIFRILNLKYGGPIKTMRAIFSKSIELYHLKGLKNLYYHALSYIKLEKYK
jgi:hypothetical protein